MLVTLAGISIDVRPVLAKATSPMVVTPTGIVEFLHPIINVLDDFSIIALQPLRESYVSFPSSTVIVSNLLHKPKASAPMLVTLAGMVIDVKSEQLLKAPTPMVVNCEPSAKETVVRPEQSSKA